MGGVINWVEDRVDDAVDAVQDAGDWVGEQVNDAVDFVVEDAPQAVSDAFAQFEDGVRETIDEVDKAIQNEYVRLAVRFIPGYGQIAGAILDTYAKLDSGEELSAGDIANLAAAYGSQNPTDWKLTPEQTKAITTSVRVAEDPDNALTILAGAYGPDIVQEMGLEDTAKQAITDTFGEDVMQIVENDTAIDLGKTGWDILVEGQDPTVAFANRFGEDIVTGLGAESTNERAVALGGLQTLVGLDQGLDADEAFYYGGKKAYDEGARLEDLQSVAGISGIDLPDFNLNDVVANLGLDFPDLETRGYELPSLASLGIDVGQFNLSGYSPTDLGYDVGQWGQLRDLGVDIGELNLDEYNFDQLANLNLDLNLPEIDKYLKSRGVEPLQYESLEEDKDLFSGELEQVASIQDDEALPLSRQLLESRVV